MQAWRQGRTGIPLVDAGMRELWHTGSMHNRVNPANWQWVAGSGADAAPYFRVFNPELQAAKFDPTGTYINRWVPQHEPRPAPIVELAQSRREALAAYESFRKATQR